MLVIKIPTIEEIMNKMVIFTQSVKCLISYLYEAIDQSHRMHKIITNANKQSKESEEERSNTKGTSSFLKDV